MRQSGGLRRMRTVEMNKRQRLDWIELGRGTAAFVVVISHIDYVRLPSEWVFLHHWGRWGVAFFFVLSGFIILHVHWQDIDVRSRAANFAWRRFLRIFPLYWLVLTFGLLIRIHLGDTSYAPNVDLAYLIHQMLLLPGRLFVNPAWTLRHELLFYGIFLVAILNRKLGIVLFALWLVTTIAFIPIVDWSKSGPARR
jgi:exopolysaccharide production protein ExoZ